MRLLLTLAYQTTSDGSSRANVDSVHDPPQNKSPIDPESTSSTVISQITDVRFSNPDILSHEAERTALISESKLRLVITALESEQTLFKKKRKLEHAVSSSSSNSRSDCSRTSVLAYIYYCR